MIEPNGLQFYELLRLAFPGKKPDHTQTGSISKENAPVVRWVVLAVADLQPGDVLIVPITDLSPELIHSARSAGCAGIVVIEENTKHTEIPPPREKLAGDVGSTVDCPVVRIKPSDLSAPNARPAELTRIIHRQLLMVLFDQRSALVERGYRIHTRLARLTADGAGLSGLVQAMAEISGRGVLVQDKRGQVLAEHASPTLAGIWGDILLELSPFKQLPEHFQDRKLAGKQNLPVMQAMAGGLARLVTPINVGGVARGYLSLVGWPGEFDVSNGNIDREPLGRTDHRFDELDHLVAEQGAVICAIEMSRSKALRETEKRLQTDLLNALLQSEFSPRDASLWAGSMGLDLLALHMAVRFAWLKPDSPSRRRLETLVHGELTRQGLHSIAAPLGAELICFIECTMQSGQATGTMDKTVDRSEIKTALSFANSVLKQAIAEFPTRPVICGVGAPVQDLSEWQRSFRQAGQALEMARRLEAVEPLYFPDLSIYRLLFQIEHNPELLAFQEEMLGALLAQDNSRELLNTLETYFKHNGNISQTAEALFIHRNTLTYRLERISTLLSQDADKVNPFENPDTRLALQLALYIFRMGNSRRA